MVPPASRWRAGPRRLARLMAGLCAFGAGEALLVASELGNSPWTVFAEGVAVQSTLSVGTATVATSLVVLALWIPLRQRPGLGTLANAVTIGLAIDATLALLPAPAGLPQRVTAVGLGVLLVALGSGLYLGAALGPGPRDGLMTALHRRTGVPIAAVRASLEVGVLAAGVVLGGTAGVGTLVFALAIGPAVALALRAVRAPPAAYS